jgi:hypothetical protein
MDLVIERDRLRRIGHGDQREALLLDMARRAASVLGDLVRDGDLPAAWVDELTVEGMVEGIVGRAGTSHDGV